MYMFYVLLPNYAAMVSYYYMRYLSLSYSEIKHSKVLNFAGRIRNNEGFYDQ